MVLFPILFNLNFSKISLFYLNILPLIKENQNLSTLLFKSANIETHFMFRFQDNDKKIFIW